MNIFHLDKDPLLCARYHCDKHVVKMILETAQMLSTAYQRHCGLDDNLYKPAYPHHPMTIWVGESIENYKYALMLGTELGKEYTKRYKKIHKSSNIISLLRGIGRVWNVENNFPSVNFTNPPLCMPDDCKRDCYIFSYRKYYKEYKSYFAKYNYSETPHWLKEVIDAR